MQAETATLINSRQIAKNATNYARLIVEKDNTVIWRGVEADDFGIDVLLEFFPEHKISGRYMPTQIKGTARGVTPLKGGPFVSCSIKTTTLEYGSQDVLPVLIMYLSLKDRLLYYGILQQMIKADEGRLKNWSGTGREVTVRLPASQKVSFDEDNFGKKLWGMYEEYLKKQPSLTC